MKRHGMFVVACLLSAGCTVPATPVHTEGHAGDSAIEVGLLFEVDGCNMYRFSDAGHYRYFVICPSGRAATAFGGHSQVAGKAIIHIPDAIQTAISAK